MARIEHASLARTNLQRFYSKSANLKVMKMSCVSETSDDN